MLPSPMRPNSFPWLGGAALSAPVSGRRRGRCGASLALVLAGSAFAQNPPGQGVEPDRWVLPEGPIAELFQRVEETGSSELEASLEELGLDPWPIWPAWSDRGPTGWGSEAPWRRWVELLRAESAAQNNAHREADAPTLAGADPERARRRAELALLARAQGRDPDAWRHLLATRDDPRYAARLEPVFLMGAPPSSLARPKEPLEPGVLLSPPLPPATDDPRGRLRNLVGRTFEHRAVRIGETVAGLRVVVEGDGIQVDLRHRSGPAVEVRVAPPVPPGVEIGLLYADWMRLDDPLAPVPFTLSTEEPEHTVWGRFRPRSERWPAPLAPRDFQVRRGRGVVVEVANLAVESDEPFYQRLSQALGELFGVPSQLQRRGTHSVEETFFEPTVLRLEGSAAGERKLLAMLSLIENYALAGGARRP